MTILLVSDYEDAAHWRARLADLAPGAVLRVWPDVGEADDITMLVLDYIPDGLFANLPNLRCIQFLGHGAGDVLTHPERPGDVPVARVKDAGIIAWMTEHTLGFVLRHRLNLETYAHQQREAQWVRHMMPIAGETRVGVLGLGSIGERIARVFADLGFVVTGWARGPHDIAGVDCRHGPDALEPLVSECDYVICVLPGTHATRGLLDAKVFAAMKEDAYFVNIGRGSVVDEEALVSALDAGRPAGAALDVFRTEPLPPESPLWRHPRVRITPHMAGGATASVVAEVAENYRRLLAGEPLLNLADPERGY